jgi:hypothetical protein
VPHYCCENHMATSERKRKVAQLETTVISLGDCSKDTARLLEDIGQSLHHSAHAPPDALDACMLQLKACVAKNDTWQENTVRALLAHLLAICEHTALHRKLGALETLLTWSERMPNQPTSGFPTMDTLGTIIKEAQMVQKLSCFITRKAPKRYARLAIRILYRSRKLLDLGDLCDHATPATLRILNSSEYGVDPVEKNMLVCSFGILRYSLFVNTFRWKEIADSLQGVVRAGTTWFTTMPVVEKRAPEARSQLGYYSDLLLSAVLEFAGILRQKNEECAPLLLGEPDFYVCVLQMLKHCHEALLDNNHSEAQIDLFRELRLQSATLLILMVHIGQSSVDYLKIYTETLACLQRLVECEQTTPGHITSLTSHQKQDTDAFVGAMEVLLLTCSQKASVEKELSTQTVNAVLDFLNLFDGTAENHLKLCNNSLKLLVAGLRSIDVALFVPQLEKLSTFFSRWLNLFIETSNGSLGTKIALRCMSLTTKMVEINILRSALIDACAIEVLLKPSFLALICASPTSKTFDVSFWLSLLHIYQCATLDSKDRRKLRDEARLLEFLVTLFNCVSRWMGDEAVPAEVPPSILNGILKILIAFRYDQNSHRIMVGYWTPDSLELFTSVVPYNETSIVCGLERTARLSIDMKRLELTFELMYALSQSTACAVRLAQSKPVLKYISDAIAYVVDNQPQRSTFLFLDKILGTMKQLLLDPAALEACASHHGFDSLFESIRNCRSQHHSSDYFAALEKHCEAIRYLEPAAFDVQFSRETSLHLGHPDRDCAAIVGMYCGKSIEAIGGFVFPTLWHMLKDISPGSASSLRRKQASCAIQYQSVDILGLRSANSNSNCKTTVSIGRQSTRSALDHHDLSKVEFVLAGDQAEAEPISANRYIIARKSPAFAAMLLGGFKEGHTETIYIGDVDRRLFKLFIQYLSATEVTPLDALIDTQNARGAYETVIGLWEYADRFLCEYLKADCSRWLQVQIQGESSGELLMMIYRKIHGYLDQERDPGILRILMESLMTD